MRVLAAVAVVLSVVAFATIQLLSSVTLAPVAQRGSWMAPIPASFSARIARAVLPLPLPPALRLVLARRALARGDGELAQSQAARLPWSADRLSLEADLADARGDAATAERDYLAAGDRDGLGRHSALLEARGDIAGALLLERRIVLRLERDRVEQDALAEAYFSLGRLEQARAYNFPVASAQREEHARGGSAAYAAAVRLAPFRERYVLAFANQQLNLGRDREAVAAFERARRIDPTIVDPLVGLADAAWRRGDVASMRAYVARARALDPSSAALRRFVDELPAAP